MNKFFKVMTLSAAIGMFGLNQANAEYDPNLKSIDTPPAVSQQMFNKVKSNGLGQYAYAKGLSSKFIESEGVKLHYVEGGSKGTPIVFIHGFGSTWKMWEPVMLSYMKDHKVIAIDLPGLGQSAPIVNDDYSAENTSKILIGAIKKIAGKGPIYYVSHDLGNTASYPLVANNQGYIKKAVFMDSPIPDRAMFEYPGYTPDGPGLGWHFGYFSFGDIAEKQIAKDPNLFFSYFIKTYAGKKEIFTPELLAELIEPYSTRDKLKAAFGYYRSHADSIRQNEALLANGKKLTIPSMALTGQKGVNDVLVKEMRARFVADPSKFTGIILPDTGHWMVEENAEGVEKSLSNFLFK
ncbi:alpha/beta hydrolase [Acinetobacter baumannii]|nr:alpha/beta hydrolase [Acinetobacter baumannii]